MFLSSGSEGSPVLVGPRRPSGPGALRAGLTLLLVLLPSLAPPALNGQGVEDLQRGDRVRVYPTHGERASGVFEGFDAGALSIGGSESNPFTIPLGSIRSLERAAGKNRGKGALIGGALGVVAGAIIGAATSGDCAGDCSDPYGIGGDDLVEPAAKGEGALLGGLIFGGIGAGVGATFLAPTRWVQVRIEPGR